MSFGKRGASPSPRGPDNGAAEASPLWRQLRTIGIGVAVGLGIAAFNFALLPYMGRAQEKRFEQQLDGGYAHALSGKSDWAKTRTARRPERFGALVQARAMSLIRCGGHS
jgi:hypothetical protein